MTKETIRVLVVEDHNVVRQGLVALLNLVEGIDVVGEAADGEEAIAQFRSHKPRCHTDRSAPAEIERSRGDPASAVESPQARFVVLTTYDGDEDIYRALKSGAKAYLLKGMTTEELITTIREVHAGRSHIPAAIAERLAERMGTEDLTPREARGPGADRLRQEQQGDRYGTRHLGSNRKDAHQHAAEQAGRDRPYPGGNSSDPAWHRSL